MALLQHRDSSVSSPAGMTSSRVSNGVAAEGGAAAAKPVQRAPLYNEHADWDTYHTQFEMLAKVNHWTEVEKVTYVAVSLKGPTLTVLSNSPPDMLYDYSFLLQYWKLAMEVHTRLSCIRQR